MAKQPDRESSDPRYPPTGETEEPEADRQPSDPRDPSTDETAELYIDEMGNGDDSNEDPPPKPDPP